MKPATKHQAPSSLPIAGATQDLQVAGPLAATVFVGVRHRAADVAQRDQQDHQARR